MAKVLTGISGNVISAASAGFAPTNSADVSAIASAYQVVSATATQLYAGTAYVTSVNDAPLSASRAGNAANASLANSAYYDGTGRLISSLPDSATVSAIASSYAESAASGKQDTLTFGYDAEDKISSIDGSALAGEDGTTYVSPSGTVWISGSSIEATDSAYLPSIEDTTLVYYSDRFTGVYTGSNAYTATGANLIYASGLFLSGTLSALDSNNVLAAVSSYSGENDVRFSASAEQGPLKLQSDSFWNMHYISAYTANMKPASVVPLAHASALPTYQYNTADQISSINGSALAGQGSATGDYLSAVSVDSNLTGDGTTASAIGLNTQIALDGTSSYIRLTNSAATVPTFAQMVSNATNGMISVSGNKANIQATGKATANFSFNCDTSGQASILSGPWLSKKYWAGVSSYYKNGTAAITVRASGSNNPTITLDGADGNSVIYLSSIPYWNAKLDESAVSGKADSSALSSYALSADVSGTVDLVSTQSANWGGSALALSAGPGVKLEKVGNTLVASTDETLLWNNTEGKLTKDLTFPLALSETITNFKRVKFLYGGDSYMQNAHWIEFEATDNNPYTLYDFRCDGPSTTNIFWRLSKFNINGTAVTNTYNSTINLNTAFDGVGYNTSGYNYLVQIVGVNRTAEA